MRLTTLSRFDIVRSFVNFELCGIVVAGAVSVVSDAVTPKILLAG